MTVARFRSESHGTRPRASRAVAYLTNQLPFPPHSGGQVRECEMIRRLSGTWDIHLTVVTPHFTRDADWIDHALGYCSSVSIFESEDGGRLGAELPDRALAHRNVLVPEHLRQQVGREQACLVHVEGYFMADLVPCDVGAPLFVMAENVEYDLERMRQAVDVPEVTVPWTVTREMEWRAWGRAVLTGAVTERDRSMIMHDVAGARVQVIPAGCDHFAPTDGDGGEAALLAAAGPLVVYTANFSWMPSADGALYLLREVWPQVRAQVPAAVLVLAGAGRDADVDSWAEKDDSVIRIGPVPSLGPLLAAAAVFVCPLRYGGGVKSKMLESLAAGCAVVSSPVGVQGLSAQAAGAVLTADGSAELAAAIATVLLDPAVRDDLRRRASAVSASLPRWADSASLLDACWSTVAREVVAGSVAQAEPDG